MDLNLRSTAIKWQLKQQKKINDKEKLFIKNA
jgi:hypothetical protein